MFIRLFILVCWMSLVGHITGVAERLGNGWDAAFYVAGMMGAGFLLTNWVMIPASSQIPDEDEEDDEEQQPLNQ
jgi:hypothetical protein